MRPRANAIGLLFHEGCLLLEEQEGIHSKGIGVFYRPLGGTIELGEPSAKTLVREFREELDAEVGILRYVSCLENIFTVQGEMFHEITQLYVVGFTDKSLYEKKLFTVTEGLKTTSAKWVPLAYLRKPETMLYPNGLLEWIEKAFQGGADE